MTAGARGRRAGRPRSRSAPIRPSTAGTARVEAYALDRDDLDLYGAHVAVDFAARLRGQVRFGSVDELVEQMRLDVEAARSIVRVSQDRGQSAGRYPSTQPCAP